MPNPPPSDTLLAGGSQRGRDEARIFAPGEILGDTYEVGALLGEGGMGQVFDALDLLLLRRVAVKAARQPDGRLLDEARALAAVRHPSLVMVLSMGRHRGLDYLVMERVYGTSLEAHLVRRRQARRAFKVSETLDVLIPLGEALAAVHRAGIAHRDVKPANVMLAPGDRVVLMDFGIFLPEFAVARPGKIAGTPHYMAPETIRGRVAPGEGHRVDMYAFGVIGYELLAGQAPYEGESVAAVLDAHLHAPVADVAHACPEVPRALARLLGELMAKDPLDRPERMEDVVFRLREVRGGPGMRPSRLPRTGPLSVLIVDDDPDAVALIRRCLELAGPVEVRAATTSTAALDAVQRRAPDLLLLDLDLPGMSGLELAMYLRGTRLADRTKIVTVSGEARRGDLAVLRELGVTHFVAKGPGLYDKLADVLAKL